MLTALNNREAETERKNRTRFLTALAVCARRAGRREALASAVHIRREGENAVAWVVPRSFATRGRNTFGAIAEEHVQRLEESGVSEATVNKKPLAANSLRGELQPQSNKTFDGITAVFGIQNSLISLKQCAPDRRHFLHQSYS